MNGCFEKFTTSLSARLHARTASALGWGAPACCWSFLVRSRLAASTCLTAMRSAALSGACACRPPQILDQKV